MADAHYRGRSRGYESSGSSGGRSHRGQYQPSTSHSSGQSNTSYPVASEQYSYYPATPTRGQHGVSSPSHPTYGHYATSSSRDFEGSASTQGYGHHRTSSGTASRHSTYPGAASASASDRALKRQRAETVPDQGAHAQAQWANASAQGHSMPENYRGYRPGERGSSSSSGYGSSGYSHDPYGQQLLQPPPSIPGAGPSTMRDPHLYDIRHSRPPTSEEEEEEEYVDHGPTDLPPRTYSGKSPYDKPKKPGKIPGSAMDYLPILEARFDRLETAIDRYVDYRGQRALSNSILPGMDAPEGSSSRKGPSASSYRQSRGSSSRR